MLLAAWKKDIFFLDNYGFLVMDTVVACRGSLRAAPIGVPVASCFLISMVRASLASVTATVNPSIYIILEPKPAVLDHVVDWEYTRTAVTEPTLLYFKLVLVMALWLMLYVHTHLTKIHLFTKLVTEPSLKKVHCNILASHFTFSLTVPSTPLQISQPCPGLQL